MDVIPHAYHIRRHVEYHGDRRTHTREGGFTPEARGALRTERAPALLDRLHRRLVELEPGKADSPVLLKSPLGKAIRYTLGHSEALVLSA